MRRIKSVGVLSVAKIAAIVYSGISLLFVPILIVAFSAGLLFPGREHASGMAAVLGIVIALFVPAFYAAFGFGAGALAAFVYNLAARHVGGIEFQTEPIPAVQP